jgi:hypothetical protein
MPHLERSGKPCLPVDNTSPWWRIVDVMLHKSQSWEYSCSHTAFLCFSKKVRKFKEDGWCGVSDNNEPRAPSGMVCGQRITAARLMSYSVLGHEARASWGISTLSVPGEAWIYIVSSLKSLFPPKSQRSSHSVPQRPQAPKNVISLPYLTRIDSRHVNRREKLQRRLFKYQFSISLCDNTFLFDSV